MADLFFYGTLCHVPLLERVLGRPAAEIALSPAVLPGWAVFWAAGECFPTIRAEAGGRAEGLLLRDLDERRWRGSITMKAGSAMRSNRSR